MIAEDLTALAVNEDTLGYLPDNPRHGDVAAVKASLEAFGQRKPIVVRRSDRTVIAGNHTLAAARELGWTQVAVVWVDDDDATAKAFALADNRTADLGGYDEQALANLIAEVQAVDEALLAATGWTPDDLLQLLDDLAAAEPAPALTDPDDVPEPPTPTSKLGDVWLAGNHRIMCGDAAKAADLERLMSGRAADMVWTDPPYGVDYEAKLVDMAAAGIAANKTRSQSKVTYDDGTTGDLASLLEAAFYLAKVNSKPGACWMVAAPAGASQLRVFVDALDDLDIIRHALVWSKDVFTLGRSDYQYRHEMLLYGWTPGAAHQPPPDRTQDTVWEFPKPRSNDLHPTMKPVALIVRAVENHTGPRQVVLDMFGGSGSTLIACEQTGRYGYVLELDPVYVDVICRRWQEHTGQQPILEATGKPHDFTR